jgi:acyl-[acyl-carrier-protein]-phospholipid O-acyltransferase / long-chain-fatty-acid--[acyl-carrier-protein] ligase
MIKKLVRSLLSLLYRVKVEGVGHYRETGERVLIIANHASFLDPVVLWAFLPDDVTFAINTHIATRAWVKPALKLVPAFAMDPMQPMSIKALTHYVRSGRKAVIFPEGRITLTGLLMKIYEGAAVIADKADAEILPIRIEGTQYSPFSHTAGVLRQRWFPQITLHICPPRKLALNDDLHGDKRRRQAALQVEDLMSDMIFMTERRVGSLFSGVLAARRLHGGARVILEDIQRRPVSYDGLITRTFVLAAELERLTAEREVVGILLPSMINTVALLFALQINRRIPAMLNSSAGARNIVAACETAAIKTVVTSRRFVEAAGLQPVIDVLQSQYTLLFLEDIALHIGREAKLHAWFKCRQATPEAHLGDAAAPAVVLFTSGTEGAPKGVVLTHANLIANRAQLLSRVDINASDVLLNVLPVFHSFGFWAGLVLPLLTGMRTFLYPSPLHYRIIPELAYDINATVMFVSNTFLAGYAKHAHPYDFHRLRYVFAGAEKLHAETRRAWFEKFGIRILEGYGVTETSPALAANTLMRCKAGTVGRLFPGVEYRLEPVEGIAQGGCLHVKGANVMPGYLLPGNHGQLEPTRSIYGEGWHNTGDLVEIDDEGYVRICGRLKRFAKIGGEMVSLLLIEEVAARVWPGSLNAAVSLPDPVKGEHVVLLTDHAGAERASLIKQVHAEGYSEFHIPRKIVIVPAMPILATGKTNYQAVRERVELEAG